jgi:ribonuclease VapC
VLRGEPGAALVAGRGGQAAKSRVKLQDLVKALLDRGLMLSVIEEMVRELGLDLQAYDPEAAFAAALLTDATRQSGSGLGDQTCMALAIKLSVPVLTMDRAWATLKISGLTVELVRWVVCW